MSVFRFRSTRVSRASVAALLTWTIGLRTMASAGVASPDVPGCFPPASGDWMISGACNLSIGAGAPGNVIVTSSGRLTLEPGVVLGIDFHSHHLEVRKGGQVLIRKGARLETLKLRLAGLEVTQAIQDLDNTMPLIAAKATVLRAYVETLNSGIPSVGAMKLRLHGRRGGVELVGSPINSHNPSFFTAHTDALSRRAQVNDSANFALPSDWLDGTVDLQVEGVDHAMGCAEQAGVPSDCSVTVSFTEKERPLYWIVPINTGSIATPVVPSSGDIGLLKGFLLATYPLAGVTWDESKTWQDIGATALDVDKLTTAVKKYYDSILWQWIIDCVATKCWISGVEPFPLPDQVFGITQACVPIAGGNSATCGQANTTWAGGNGVTAWGSRGGTTFGASDTMAHEINHNLDRKSDPTWGRHVGNPTPGPTPTPAGMPSQINDPNWGCGASGVDTDGFWTTKQNDLIDEVGFNTSDNTTRNSNLPDFMSYCNKSPKPGVWISTYRWQRLSEYFHTGLLASTAGSRMADRHQQIPPIVPVYYIPLDFSIDGSGKIGPMMVQPGWPSDGLQPGDYALECRDAKGILLSRLVFDVQFVSSEGTPVSSVYMQLRLPVMEGVARIDLMRGPHRLDSRIVSASTPLVTVLSPNGGEHWGNSRETVSWRATDADGDALVAQVLYSPQDGRHWRVIARDVQQSSTTIDPSVLSGGNGARVRVVITDGFNTAEDDSDAVFSVGRKAPIASVISPPDESYVRAEDQVELRGNASDLEDGPLPSESLTWTLEGAGRHLGTGELISVAAATLGAGRHTITLKASDSDGMTGSMAVHVIVRPSGPAIFLPWMAEMLSPTIPTSVDRRARPRYTLVDAR